MESVIQVCSLPGVSNCSNVEIGKEWREGKKTVQLLPPRYPFFEDDLKVVGAGDVPSVEGSAMITFF